VKAVLKNFLVRLRTVETITDREAELLFYFFEAEDA